MFVSGFFEVRGPSLVIVLSSLPQPLDPADGGDVVGLAPAGRGEVEGGLQSHPHFGAAAEGFGEAQGHFGGDAAAFVDEAVEGLAGDAEGFGGFADGEAEGFDAVLADDAAGVGRGVHRGFDGQDAVGHG